MRFSALAFVLLSACAGHADSAPPPPSAAPAPGEGTPIAEANPNPAPTEPPAPPPPAGACEPTSPRATPVTVHVFPDAGETPYVDALASAKKSIRVFGYLMGYGAIYDTLKERAKAGVDVRVILDGDKQRDVNEKYRTGLEAEGVRVEWSDPQFSYMHAKAMVIDDERALVSTGNYSKSFMLKERNFLAALDDIDDVKDIAALFDADWSRMSPDLSCTRLLVSPINARDRLVELVAGAKTEVLIESMQLADKGVRSALQGRLAAGVSVRVVLASPTWIDANADAATWLASQGVVARHLSTPSVHVKAIVIDGVRAYLGSENLSQTSLDRNREIGLVVTDAPAVTAMKETFETDYAAATPF